MNKLKALFFILVGVFLVVFAMENLQPSPTIKLFRNEIVTLPTFAIIYAFLAVGFVVGWAAHTLRMRKKRRAAEAAALAQQQAASQPNQQAS